MPKQRWQDRGIFLIGVYVFFSPWLVPYLLPGAAVSDGIVWSHYVVGATIAMLAYGALVSGRLWLEWIVLTIGSLLTASAWIIGVSAMIALAWSAVVAGSIVATLAAWSLLSGKEGSQARQVR